MLIRFEQSSHKDDMLNIYKFMEMCRVLFYLQFVIYQLIITFSNDPIHIHVSGNSFFFFSLCNCPGVELS